MKTKRQILSEIAFSNSASGQSPDQLINVAIYFGEGGTVDGVIIGDDQDGNYTLKRSCGRTVYFNVEDVKYVMT